MLESLRQIIEKKMHSDYDGLNHFIIDTPTGNGKTYHTTRAAYATLLVDRSKPTLVLFSAPRKNTFISYSDLTKDNSDAEGENKDTVPVLRLFSNDDYLSAPLGHTSLQVPDVNTLPDLLLTLLDDRVVVRHIDFLLGVFNGRDRLAEWRKLEKLYAPNSQKEIRSFCDTTIWREINGFHQWIKRRKLDSTDDIYYKRRSSGSPVNVILFLAYHAAYQITYGSLKSATQEQKINCFSNLNAISYMGGVEAHETQNADGTLNLSLYDALRPEGVSSEIDLTRHALSCSQAKKASLNGVLSWLGVLVRIFTPLEIARSHSAFIQLTHMKLRCDIPLYAPYLAESDGRTTLRIRKDQSDLLKMLSSEPDQCVADNTGSHSYATPFPGNARSSIENIGYAAYHVNRMVGALETGQDVRESDLLSARASLYNACYRPTIPCYIGIKSGENAKMPYAAGSSLSNALASTLLIIDETDTAITDDDKVDIALGDIASDSDSFNIRFSQIHTLLSDPILHAVIMLKMQEDMKEECDDEDVADTSDGSKDSDATYRSILVAVGIRIAKTLKRLHFSQSLYENMQCALCPALSSSDMQKKISVICDLEGSEKLEGDEKAISVGFDLINSLVDMAGGDGAKQDLTSDVLTTYSADAVSISPILDRMRISKLNGINYEAPDAEDGVKPSDLEVTRLLALAVTVIHSVHHIMRDGSGMREIVRLEARSTSPSSCVGSALLALSAPSNAATALCGVLDACLNFPSDENDSRTAQDAQHAVSMLQAALPIIDVKFKKDKSSRNLFGLNISYISMPLGMRFSVFLQNRRNIGIFLSATQRRDVMGKRSRAKYTEYRGSLSPFAVNQRALTTFGLKPRLMTLTDDDVDDLLAKWDERRQTRDQKIGSIVASYGNTSIARTQRTANTENNEDEAFLSSEVRFAVNADAENDKHDNRKSVATSLSSVLKLSDADEKKPRRRDERSNTIDLLACFLDAQVNGLIITRRAAHANAAHEAIRSHHASGAGRVTIGRKEEVLFAVRFIDEVPHPFLIVKGKSYNVTHEALVNLCCKRLDVPDVDAFSDYLKALTKRASTLKNTSVLFYVDVKSDDDPATMTSIILRGSAEDGIEEALAGFAVKRYHFERSVIVAAAESLKVGFNGQVKYPVEQTSGNDASEVDADTQSEGEQEFTQCDLSVLGVAAMGYYTNLRGNETDNFDVDLSISRDAVDLLAHDISTDPKILNDGRYYANLISDLIQTFGRTSRLSESNLRNPLQKIRPSYAIEMTTDAGDVFCGYRGHFRHRKIALAGETGRGLIILDMPESNSRKEDRLSELYNHATYDLKTAWIRRQGVTSHAVLHLLVAAGRHYHDKQIIGNANTALSCISVINNNLDAALRYANVVFHEGLNAYRNGRGYDWLPEFNTELRQIGRGEEADIAIMQLISSFHDPHTEGFPDFPCGSALALMDVVFGGRVSLSGTYSQEKVEAVREVLIEKGVHVDVINRYQILHDIGQRLLCSMVDEDQTLRLTGGLPEISNERYGLALQRLRHNTIVQRNGDQTRIGTYASGDENGYELIAFHNGDPVFGSQVMGGMQNASGVSFEPQPVPDPSTTAQAFCTHLKDVISQMCRPVSLYGDYIPMGVALDVAKGNAGEAVGEALIEFLKSGSESGVSWVNEIVNLDRAVYEMADLTIRQTRVERRASVVHGSLSSEDAQDCASHDDVNSQGGDVRYIFIDFKNHKRDDFSGLLRKIEDKVVNGGTTVSTECAYKACSLDAAYPSEGNYDNIYIILNIVKRHRTGSCNRDVAEGIKDSMNGRGPEVAVLSIFNESGKVHIDDTDLTRYITNNDLVWLTDNLNGGE